MILNKLSYEFKNISDFCYDKYNKFIYFIQLINNDIILKKWKGNTFITELIRFNKFLFNFENSQKNFIKSISDELLFLASSNGKYLLFNILSKELIKLNSFENINFIKEIFIIDSFLYLFNSLENKLFLIDIDYILENKKIKILKFLNLPNEEIKEFKVINNKVYFIVENNLFSMNDKGVKNEFKNINNFKMYINESNQNMILFNSEGYINIYKDNNLLHSLKLDNIFINELISLNNIFFLILDEDNNIFIFNSWFNTLNFIFKLNNELDWKDPFIFTNIDNFLFIKNIKKNKIIAKKELKNKKFIAYEYFTDIIIFKTGIINDENYKIFEFLFEPINYSNAVNKLELNNKIILNTNLYFISVDGIYLFNINSQKTKLLLGFINETYVKKMEFFNENLIINIKNKKEQGLYFFNIKTNKLNLLVENIDRFVIFNYKIYYLKKNKIYNLDNNFSSNEINIIENKKIKDFGYHNEILFINMGNILISKNERNILEIKLKFNDLFKISNNYIVIYNYNVLKIYHKMKFMVKKDFKYEISKIILFEDYIIVNLINNQSYVYLNNNKIIKHFNHNSYNSVNSYLIPLTLDKNLIIFCFYRNNKLIINIKLQKNDNSILYIKDDIEWNKLEDISKIVYFNYFNNKLIKNKSIIYFLLENNTDNNYFIDNLYDNLIFLGSHKIFLIYLLNLNLYKPEEYLKLKYNLRYPKSLKDYEIRKKLNNYNIYVENSELTAGNKIWIYELLDQYSSLFEYLYKFNFPINNFLIKTIINEKLSLNIKSIFNLIMSENENINKKPISSKNNWVFILPLIKKYLEKFNEISDFKKLENINWGYGEKLIKYYNKDNIEIFNYEINNYELLLGLEKKNVITKEINNDSIDGDNNILIYLHFNNNRLFLKNFINNKKINITYQNYSFEELEEEDPLEFKDNWGQNCSPVYSLNCEKGEGFIHIQKDIIDWEDTETITWEFYLKTFEIEKMIIFSMGNNLLSFIYKNKSLIFIYNQKEIGKIDFINFNKNWHFYGFVIKKNSLKFFLIDEFEYTNDNIDLSSIFNKDIFLFFDSKINFTELRLWKIERTQDELEQYSNYPLELIFSNNNKLNIEINEDNNENKDKDINNKDFKDFIINEENNKNFNNINETEEIKENSVELKKSWSENSLTKISDNWKKNLLSNLNLKITIDNLYPNDFKDKIIYNFENLLITNRKLWINDKYGKILKNINDFLNELYNNFDKDNVSKYFKILRSWINYKILFSHLSKFRKLDFSNKQDYIIWILYILINLYLKLEDRIILILLSINLNFKFKNDGYVISLFKILKQFNYRYTNNKEKIYFENIIKNLDKKNRIDIMIVCPYCREDIKFKGNHKCYKCFKEIKFCYKSLNFYKNNSIKECLLCKFSQNEQSIIGKNCNFCLIGNYNNNNNNNIKIN